MAKTLLCTTLKRSQDTFRKLDIYRIQSQKLKIVSTMQVNNLVQRPIPREDKANDADTNLSNDVLLALIIHLTLYLSSHGNEQRVFSICCFYLIVWKCSGDACGGGRRRGWSCGKLMGWKGEERVMFKRKRGVETEMVCILCKEEERRVIVKTDKWATLLRSC